MSMTGGISFFEKNKILYADGSSAVASSNTAAQNLCLGTNKYFKWISSGSNDATTETLTITFASSVEISRIFIVNHNLKAFTVKYGAGAGSNFSGVTGMDSYSESKIQETIFARNTAYYEFTPVTTNRLILTMTTTQTANADKFVGQIIATNEIGTLTGFPKLSGVALDRNAQKEKAISGRLHVQKGYEAVNFDLDLSNYPYQTDIDILDGLHDGEDPFIVWLCGGVPDYFTLTQRGFRVEDVYQMQIDAQMRNSYEKNVYVMGAKQQYSFAEVV